MTSCNILTWTPAFGAEDPRLKYWRSTTKQVLAIHDNSYLITVSRTGPKFFSITILSFSRKVISNFSKKPSRPKIIISDAM